MSEKLFVDEDHTKNYRLYRPNYPPELYEYITNFYFNGQPSKAKIPLALDVACGSGQATVALSSVCDRVIGIDVSANQISQAIPRENVEYRCQAAEDLSFLADNSVDLVTIATAVHWFDIEAFFKEVHRVLRAHTGVIAIWTYTLGQLNNPRANALYNHLLYDVVLPHGNVKGASAMDGYQSIRHLFPYPASQRDYSMDHPCSTSIDQLLGFIQSLSPCQGYRKERGEQAYHELLTKFRAELTECLDTGEPLTVTHPLRLYLMRKDSPVPK